MSFGKKLIMAFVGRFWFGLNLCDEGEVSPGDVLTCMTPSYKRPFQQIAICPKILVLTKVMSAGQAIQGYIGDTEKKDDNRSKIMLGCSGPQKRCEGDVEIKGVTFAYPPEPEQPVMKNVNFSFPLEETTFLFGKNGSGKSTISNVLLKFYDSSEGEIGIDGQRIEKLDTR